MHSDVQVTWHDAGSPEQELELFSKLFSQDYEMAHWVRVTDNKSDDLSPLPRALLAVEGVCSLVVFWPSLIHILWDACTQNKKQKHLNVIEKKRKQNNSRVWIKHTIEVDCLLKKKWVTSTVEGYRRGLSAPPSVPSGWGGDEMRSLRESTWWRAENCALVILIF